MQPDDQNGLRQDPSVFRPLPQKLVRDGIEVEQKWRGLTQSGKPVAIYGPPQGCGDWFDVIYIQQRAAEKIRGKDYPARESYPSAESWGTEGWSPIGWAAAVGRLKAMGVLELPIESGASVF